MTANYGRALYDMYLANLDDPVDRDAFRAELDRMEEEGIDLTEVSPEEVSGRLRLRRAYGDL